MSLSDPRTFFGIYSVSPYNRDTGLPYGELRVLEESSLTLAGELIDLMGGSAKYPWASEDGAITSEMTLKGSQYEDFMFELFLGKAPTPNSAETTGSVTTLTNKNGTSLQNATTGVASVAIKSGSDADAKFRRYVVKVVSPTTVDVYVKSDIDNARGTNGTTQNDLLKITASPLTVTTGSVHTTIPNEGVDLIGGSGTIGMTTGDTAEFSSRPDNTKSMDVRIGSSVDTSFPEFGCVVMAQKRGNQELMEIDLFRCKSAGMPIAFQRNAWSKYEIKIKVLYDSAKDGLFDLRHVTPSNT